MRSHLPWSDSSPFSAIRSQIIWPKGSWLLSKAQKLVAAFPGLKRGCPSTGNWLGLGCAWPKSWLPSPPWGRMLCFPSSADLTRGLCPLRLPRWCSSKESTRQCRSHRRHGWGRSPGREHGNPLQYACLEKPMDKGAWKAIVYRVMENQRPLSDWAHRHAVSICPSPLPSSCYLSISIYFVKH